MYAVRNLLKWLMSTWHELLASYHAQLFTTVQLPYAFHQCCTRWSQISAATATWTDRLGDQLQWKYVCCCNTELKTARAAGALHTDAARMQQLLVHGGYNFENQGLCEVAHVLMR